MIPHRSAIRRLMVALGLVAASLTFSAVPAAAAVGVPLPTDDPFYAVPADVGSHAEGAILASRPVLATAFSVPLPAKAWQVKYRTTDNTGRASATVTTVLVPVVPWLGPGKRPIVSYQVAEDGVGAQCAPSYSMRAGAADPLSNSTLETPVIKLALTNGWAVVVPDYEGPNSAFLGGRGEGRMVLDGIRAAQHFSTAGLSTANPVGLWGYSGGALATAAAVQLQPSYAPELTLAGAATGGLVADIDATTRAFDDSAASGALIVGIIGMMRANPDFDFAPYLNRTAMTHIAAGQEDCITHASIRFPGVHLADLVAYPGAFDDPAVQNLLRSNGPNGIDGTPTTPIYDYHATADEFAPITHDRQLMTRYCTGGAVVQHVEEPGEHFSELVAGAPGAIAFLNKRFSGATPTDNCGSFLAA